MNDRPYEKGPNPFEGDPSFGADHPVVPSPPTGEGCLPESEHHATSSHGFVPSGNGRLDKWSAVDGTGTGDEPDGQPVVSNQPDHAVVDPPNATPEAAGGGIDDSGNKPPDAGGDAWDDFFDDGSWIPDELPTHQGQHDGVSNIELRLDQYEPLVPAVSTGADHGRSLASVEALFKIVNTAMGTYPDYVDLRQYQDGSSYQRLEVQCSSPSGKRYGLELIRNMEDPQVRLRIRSGSGGEYQLYRARLFNNGELILMKRRFDEEGYKKDRPGVLPNDGEVPDDLQQSLEFVDPRRLGNYLGALVLPSPEEIEHLGDFVTPATPSPRYFRELQDVYIHRLGAVLRPEEGDPSTVAAAVRFDKLIDSMLNAAGITNHRDIPTLITIPVIDAATGQYMKVQYGTRRDDGGAVVSFARTELYLDAKDAMAMHSQEERQELIAMGATRAKIVLDYSNDKGSFVLNRTAEIRGRNKNEPPLRANEPVRMILDDLEFRLVRNFIRWPAIWPPTTG